MPPELLPLHKIFCKVDESVGPVEFEINVTNVAEHPAASVTVTI